MNEHDMEVEIDLETCFGFVMSWRSIRHVEIVLEVTILSQELGTQTTQHFLYLNFALYRFSTYALCHTS